MKNIDLQTMKYLFKQCSRNPKLPVLATDGKDLYKEFEKDKFHKVTMTKEQVRKIWS